MTPFSKLGKIRMKENNPTEGGLNSANGITKNFETHANLQNFSAPYLTKKEVVKILPIVGQFWFWEKEQIVSL